MLASIPRSWKIHAMIMRNEKKRYQFPPYCRLSMCSFGHERLMPLTNKYGGRWLHRLNIAWWNARNATRSMADRHLPVPAVAATREACSFGRSAGQDRGREESPTRRIMPRGKVMVGVRRSAGAVAVILAYVGALAVLLAVLVAAVAASAGARPRRAAALGAVVVYYCVLWLFRHKIEHTIHFSITKHY